MVESNDATDGSRSSMEFIVREAAAAAAWSADECRRSLAWLKGLPLAAQSDLIDVACGRWQREYIEAYEGGYGGDRDPLAFREQFAEIYAAVVVAARDRLARLGCADAHEEGLLQELRRAVTVVERMVADGPPRDPPPPTEQDALLDLLRDEESDYLLTIKEVEAWLGLNERTIRKKRDTEAFPERVSRDGGRDQYSAVEIGKWYRTRNLRTPSIERLPARIREKLDDARERLQARDRKAREDSLGQRRGADARD